MSGVNGNIEAQLEVADVYAAALFSLARERDAIESVRSELDELHKLLDRDPDFEQFIGARIIDSQQRIQTLENLLRGKLSDELLNTLLVMIEHERGDMIRALHRAYILRQEEHAGQVEVTATTAIEVDDETREKITRLAGDLSGKTPLMKFNVDRGILGGLVLEIGDLRYDNSVRRQLADARERLAARAERGLDVTIAEE